VEKVSGFVMARANARSFDSVRLSPHFAQDDKGKQVLRYAQDDNSE